MKTSNRFLIILVLMLILVVMRIHFVTEPFERDEGGHAYMAQRFLKGETLYRDYWDSKPPGIVFIYASMFKFYEDNLITVRVLSIFFGLIALLLVFLLTEEIYNDKIACFAALFYAIFSGGPLIQGCSANAEPFMVIFTLLGLYLFVKAEKNRSNIIYLLSGIAFGSAFMVKQIALAGFLAVCIYILLIQRNNIKRFMIILAGFAVSWLPVIFYFWYKGILNDFIYAVFVFNFTYVKVAYTWDWLRKAKDIFFYITRENSLLWFLGISALFMDRKNIIIKLWFLAAVVCISVSGRFFPHYYIQIIPVLSVLSGYSFYTLFSKIKSREFWRNNANVFAVVTVAFLIMVICINQYRFYLKLSPDEVSRVKYSWDFVAMQAIGEEIGRQTGQDDLIYVWGNEPEIYFYSKRECPTKYIYSLHMRISPYFKEMAQKQIKNDLLENKPKLIVVLESFDDFPWMQEFIRTYYRPRDLLGMEVYEQK